MKLTKSFSKIGQRFRPSQSKMVNRWTLMLPGAGCEYYKKSGGCTMCGFYKANKNYSLGLVYPSAVFKGLYIIAEKEINSRQPQELFLYNGGSFFNPREIPENFAKYLFKSVRRHPTIERVMVESRVEYINQNKIDSSLAALGNKKLLIGIGLESRDDHVRNNLIRKGLAIKDFEEAVVKIRESGAQILAYVFLKPLGLTEEEALEDTWKTIEYCRFLGVEEIEMSCAFIQPGTKMAEAYQRGEFRPPNLWTIINIIQRAADAGWTISIGSFDDEPPPIAIPNNNCPDNCSPLIYQLIDNYRGTGQLNFLQLPRCYCRQL
jgi:archaeosine synthase beta-subunit